MDKSQAMSLLIKLSS